MQKRFTHMILMTFVLMVHCMQGASSSSSALSRRRSRSFDDVRDASMSRQPALSDIISLMNSGGNGFEAFEQKVLYAPLSDVESSLAVKVMAIKTKSTVKWEYRYEEGGSFVRPILYRFMLPGHTITDKRWVNLLKKCSEEAVDADMRVKAAVYQMRFRKYLKEMETACEQRIQQEQRQSEEDAERDANCCKCLGATGFIASLAFGCSLFMSEGA